MSKNATQIRKETNSYLLKLAIFTLVVFGGLIVGLIYGWTGILTAFPILLFGAGLVFIQWLILKRIEYWRAKID